jgi:hypothetical protein
MDSLIEQPSAAQSSGIRKAMAIMPTTMSKNSKSSIRVE